MALAKCKECGGKASTEATVCPHCGCPDPAATDPLSNCRDCDGIVSVEAATCPHCGCPDPASKKEAAPPGGVKQPEPISGAGEASSEAQENIVIKGVSDENSPEKPSLEADVFFRKIKSQDDAQNLIKKSATAFYILGGMKILVGRVIGSVASNPANPEFSDLAYYNHPSYYIFPVGVIIAAVLLQKFKDIIPAAILLVASVVSAMLTIMVNGALDMGHISSIASSIFDVGLSVIFIWVSIRAVEACRFIKSGQSHPTMPPWPK